MECPFCDLGCEECDEGRLEFHRCPTHELSGKESDVIAAWLMLKTHKIWPVAGGTDDQCASFVEAVRALDAEAAAHKERERKRHSK